MKAEFSEGDYLYYFNPGHQYHMMMFRLSTICPAYATTIGQPEYLLVYGTRTVAASYEQLLRLDDPKVQGIVLKEPSFTTSNWVLQGVGELATGDTLDNIGKMFGVFRLHNGEPDADYRERVREVALKLNGQNPISIGYDVVADPHTGHEVVENHAGGKAFKYCRKCKVEVLG